MTDASAHRRLPLRQWLGYAVVWLALVAGMAVTLALAYVPLGRAQAAVHLAVAALQIALIWSAFMNLRRSSALVRLTACSAALWLVFMFALTFNDYFSR